MMVANSNYELVQTSITGEENSKARETIPYEDEISHVEP